MLAYAVSFRVLAADRERLGDPVADPMARATLLVLAVAGAALGAKALCWFEDPAVLAARWSDWQFWFEGKSIVGALLGGLFATELAKPALGIRVSTGDLYVRPLGVGMVLGRIGCFLSGVTDGTHGQPTSLPWGMDLGDGIARHPTALYEIGVIVALTLVVGRVRWRRSGDRFAAWMVGYLLWRLAVENIKTQPFPYGGLSAIQLACLLGLGWYVAFIGYRVIPARSPVD